VIALPYEEVLRMITGEVFTDIKAMYRNGLRIRRIARITGRHRLTVKRHMESESFPEYHRTQKRKSILDPYLKIIEDYLEQDDCQAT
jgi:transposase